MSDKPTPADAPWFALPGQRVVALAGRDALAFAQAQTMNDVAALADGQWQWNGWLTPKGRLLALFALLRMDAETAWLLLPDADAADFAAQLQRFVFRSKVQVAVRGELQVAGAFAAPQAARGDLAAGTAADAGGVQLDLGGEGGARTWRIAAAPAPPDAGAAARWDAFDLRHGLPRLPADQAGHWTPQQLSLERLRAFSVKKGCYPGQEIVARTHFLGQAKRGLALFEADAPVAAGAPVRAGDADAGTVVAAAGGCALAVVPHGLQGPVDAGGIVLRPAPLLGGLARPPG